jgi:hypothetical protein
MSTENLFSYHHHHLRYSCLFVEEMLSVDDFATLKAYPFQSDLSIFNLSPDFI